MDLQEVRCGGLDWIELALDWDRWRALVSTVMNLRGSIKCGEFLDWLQNQLASQEGLCSMEYVSK